MIEYGDDGVNKKWIEVEGAISDEVCRQLEQYNYYVQKHEGDIDLYFGGVHGITFDAATGSMHGGADTRRDGKALGY
jgi:gamma-glutamyltranspeptidase